MRHTLTIDVEDYYYVPSKHCYAAHQRMPFWRTMHTGIARLREADPGVRTLVRGILSQGFHAVLVSRIFRWCDKHRIPTQPLHFFIERFMEITTGIAIPAEAR
jgi:serine acetyltransferase